MVRQTFNGPFKLTTLLVTIVTSVYIIYLIWPDALMDKVETNLSLGITSRAPVNKSSQLMDCQDREKYLQVQEKLFDQQESRLSNHCPIRSIIQTLHSKSTSIEDFTTAVLSLGECQSIYYPRVPKCASRTTTSIFRQLAKKHHFRTPSEGPKFDFISPALEHKYLRNVSNQAKPVLYSRQVHYINFTRYHGVLPVQISIIRDPIARLTSSYYYRIHGSNNQNHSTQHVNLICMNKTLDETVAEMGSNLSTDISSLLHPCWPRGTSQLIFFCDCIAACQKASKYRLNEALKALENDFLLVGMTENIPEYMEALDILLPHFFRGAKQTFENRGLELEQKTKTRKKSSVNAVTHGLLREVLADDYTFYYRAKQRFNNILQRLRKSQSDIEDLV